MFTVLSDPGIYEFENSPPASKAWLTERFARLETRGTKDGREHWLNWVIRLSNAELAGYVQATIMPSQVAYLAYELASRFWRKGIGSDAVTAVEKELIDQYAIRTIVAVLKVKNFRSSRFLSSLGFAQGSQEMIVQLAPEPDEIVMFKNVGHATSAA